MTVDRIIWLKTEFIPILINSGKLFLKSEDKFSLRSCVVKNLHASGFMLAEPYKVKLIFEKRSIGTDNISLVEFNLVIKITPSVSEEMYLGCQFDTLFENEEIAYTEVIPLLGEEGKFPKYYFSQRKQMEAIIVLEDFSIHGWKMTPKVVNLSMDHILLAMKELGRFHGNCYAIKEKQPELFKKIIKSFKESRFGRDNIDPVWDVVMKIGPKRGTKAVRENSKMKNLIPEEFLQKIEQELAEPIKFGRRAVEPKEPLAIICHGDYLRNNIAFKYQDEENTIPTAAMMFDFQTLRYSSPIIDFSIFLTNSTSYDEREDHFETIFKTYYEELINSLCQRAVVQRSSLPDHYSYECFLREFAEYHIYGYLIASSFLPILHVPDELSNTLNQDLPIEHHINEAYNKGGEAVDRELRSIIYEIYKYQKKFGLYVD